MREQLEQQRQAGVHFAAAWTAALAALPPDEKREWLEALEDTAAAWRAAYRGEPATRAQWALHAVGEDPDREVPTGAADPWERVCAGCAGYIPEGRQRNARYCSRACQRAVHARRAPEVRDAA